MKTFAIAVLAVGGLVSGLAPAHAHDSLAVTFNCQFSSNDDPTHLLANPDTQVGVVFSGPVAAVDLPDLDRSIPPNVDPANVTNNPVTISVHCWIQVNGTGYANDTASVVASADRTSNPTPAVGMLAPAEIQFPDATNTWLCSSWTLDDGDSSTTYYSDDASGVLTTDPAAALCGLATRQSEDPCEILPLPAPVCPFPVGKP